MVQTLLWQESSYKSIHHTSTNYTDLGTYHSHCHLDLSLLQHWWRIINHIQSNNLSTLSANSGTFDTLALICAFSLPFPFLSIHFFPDKFDDFWDFCCPLPFLFRFFPLGQWFCVVWFVFPDLAHFCPMLLLPNILHSWELVEGWALSKCLSLSPRLFLQDLCNDIQNFDIGNSCDNIQVLPGC